VQDAQSASRNYGSGRLARSAAAGARGWMPRNFCKAGVCRSILAVGAGQEGFRGCAILASRRLELLMRVHGRRAVVLVTPPVTSLELRRKATPYCSKLAWCCSKPMTRAGLTVYPFWLPLIRCGGRPATGEVMILQRVLPQHAIACSLLTPGPVLGAGSA